MQAEGFHQPCSSCGARVSSKDGICPRCGDSLQGSTVIISPVISEKTQRTQSEEKPLVTVKPVMFYSKPVSFCLCLLLIPAVIGIVLWVVWWLKCRGMSLTVTQQQTILRYGIITPSIQTVPHRSLRKIEIQQTWEQKIFGAGTLVLSTTCQEGKEIEFGGILNPRRIAHKLHQQLGKFAP